MSDLLTIGRSPGRGTGVGPLASGLGEPAEIRPASGNLAAVPTGPGITPVVRRTPAQLVDPASALAAPSARSVPGAAADHARTAPGAARARDTAPVRREPVERVPLLTPSLREPTGHSGAAAATSTARPGNHTPGRAAATTSPPTTAATDTTATNAAATDAAATNTTATNAAATSTASATTAPGQAPVRRSLGRPVAVRPPLAMPAGRSAGQAGAQAAALAAAQGHADPAAALLADPAVRRLLRPPAGAGTGASTGTGTGSGTGAGAATAAAGATPGSLLERTAAAFARDSSSQGQRSTDAPPVPGVAVGPGHTPTPPAGHGATIRRTPQGLTMTKTSDWAEQLSAPVTPASALSGVELDAVVDAVVERIEQRVVDELERRGRRDGRSW